ncbi:globin CTT-VIII-like [Chironomus tepperi]|uniref:globin CTT-VIII-like n=1 Tax=Chironomus tepperi TaxID=113505 RepID=UPI00391F6062
MSATSDLVPISSEEADTLRTLWNRVKHREADILYVIFKENPEIQAHFPAFVGKDLEALRGSIAFAIHATRIVSFFSKIASLAGDPNNIPASKTLMNELGSSHKSRGIQKEFFNKFRTSLDGFMKRQTSWNDDAAAVWNKASNNFYFVLFSTLDGNPVN